MTCSTFVYSVIKLNKNKQQVFSHTCKKSGNQNISKSDINS